MILFAFFVLGFCRPQFEPFRKHQGFNGKHLKHHFQHENEDGKSHFQYEAVLAEEGIWLLDDDLRVIDVKDCNENSFTIITDQATEQSEMIKEVQPGSLVSGGRQWGCGETIMRRVKGTTLIEGELKIWTENASFVDFFKHVSLHFETSQLKYHHRPTKVNSEKTRRDLKVEGFTDFLYEIWGGILSFAERVADAVSDLFNAIKSIADGDYYTEQTFTMNVASWNYDNITKSAKEVQTISDGVYCTNCYWSWDTTLKFTLNISDHSLEELYMSLGGRMEMNIEGVVNGTKAMKLSLAKELLTIHGPSVAFAIGAVPCTLGLAIPIGIDVDLETENFVDVRMSLNQVSVSEYGMSYNKKTGWDFVVNSQHHNDGNYVNNIIHPVKKTLAVGITPKLVIVFVFNDRCGNVNQHNISYWRSVFWFKTIC